MIKRIEAHILYKKDCLGNDEYRLAMFPLEQCGYVTIGVREFDVEIPDDFDPRQQQVEILRKERERIGTEFAARCTQIDRQINELTALECI